MDKHNKLLALARKRQQNCYKDYKNLADFHGGYYEVNYVSPYSTTAHNVNADVMLIMQDWSSTEAMEQEGICAERKKLGYTKGRKANVKLFQLLQTCLGLNFEDTYATNVFPYIKQGNISKTIPAKDLKQGAIDFSLPMIRIVSPRIAICFGLSTFNALRQANGLKKVRNMGEAVNAPFVLGDTHVCCQHHPSTRLSNKQVEKNWQEMATVLLR